MIKDTEHCILCTSYGEMDVCACTVENAYAILKNHLSGVPSDIPKEVKDLAARLGQPAKEQQTILWPDTSMQHLLTELQSANSIGKESPRLRTALYGTRQLKEEPNLPAAVVTQEMNDELILWLHHNNLSCSSLTCEKLQKHKPEQTLSFLAPMVARLDKPIEYVSSTLLDSAEELNIIERNSWREDAMESRVVSRILEFMNPWLHKTNYRVVRFNKEFC